MDGIAASSFGGLPPLTSFRASQRARQESTSLSRIQQSSVAVSISQGGGVLARKARVQSDQLSQLDPKLTTQYRAVIDLLNRTNPHAVEHFLDFMDTVLAGAEGTEDNVRFQASAFSQDLGVSVEVAAQAGEFVSQIRAERTQIVQESQEIDLQIRGERPSQKKVDPLVLDLDGDGIETSGLANGVFFDLEANGRLDFVSFVQSEDALVALDRNGNGVIDDGGELFGTQHGAQNGFEELKKFDDNHDGEINKHDAVFSQLLGLQRGASGFTLTPLSQLGVQGISTTYENRQESLKTGDEILQSGVFRYSTGQVGRAVDVGFSLRV